jgi:hypothetical protein
MCSFCLATIGAHNFFLIALSKLALFTRYHYRGGLATELCHQGGEPCAHSVWRPWD